MMKRPGIWTWRELGTILLLVCLLYALAGICYLALSR